MRFIIARLIQIFENGVLPESLPPEKLDPIQKLQGGGIMSLFFLHFPLFLPHFPLFFTKSITKISLALRPQKIDPCLVQLVGEDGGNMLSQLIRSSTLLVGATVSNSAESLLLKILDL